MKIMLRLFSKFKRKPKLDYIKSNIVNYTPYFIWADVATDIVYDVTYRIRDKLTYRSEIHTVTYTLDQGAYNTLSAIRLCQYENAYKPGFSIVRVTEREQVPEFE